MKQDAIKSKQLGVAISTARSQLFKIVIFDLISDTPKAICYRCGERIKAADECSLDHKEPWLFSADPKGKFFDLKNIAFSHTTCNTGCRRCSSEVRSNTGYKGVTRCSDAKRKRPYRAEVVAKDMRTNLGYFETAKEAARAYDSAAIALWGNRAVTNESLGLL